VKKSRAAHHAISLIAPFGALYKLVASPGHLERRCSQL
jgi:hypothetical protein